MPKTDIVQALDAYDAWLGRHCAVIPEALARKRQRMAADPFAFLRGTAFRFAAQFAALLPKLAATRRVPSCGDAHLENFGTWRDAEGRLVWGVNDLDEAAALPFAADLVRLATSALLARRDGGPGGREIAETLLRGYAAHLAAPRAFVLDEEHAALRALVLPDPPARAAFWAKLAALPAAAPPPDWRQALTAALPPGAAAPHFAAREAGLGSLGRPRLVAIATWRGGQVVREAKARVPSAWRQAGFPGAAEIDVAALANSPNRAADPWYALPPGLVIRRLAPDSRKLEVPAGGDGAGPLLSLLEAMGGEIGNLHADAGPGTGAPAGAGAGAAILGDLEQMPPDWLRDAARVMADAVRADQAALAAASGSGKNTKL
ncbi:DUF2252 family protein [Roseicella sp. DB1501]|uniref:DUF2252 family protein n=1 Tax=Roseicella sp. DB1501 TaxID=2730925 RepID=UPI0014921C86|nr:DUF2252 family protein [Roseicella sp. DB1501]NOG71118.1 DUF2252 family protein [Roseicella sp. DB1501]